MDEQITQARFFGFAQNDPLGFVVTAVILSGEGSQLAQMTKVAQPALPKEFPHGNHGKTALLLIDS